LRNDDSGWIDGGWRDGRVEIARVDVVETRAGSVVVRGLECGVFVVDVLVVVSSDNNNSLI
jgi:hypothetical protein